MFTGIVEERGRVVALTDLGDAVRLSVAGPLVVSDARHGDSIAVNGCCLTVMAKTDTTFDADVMKETIDKTNLGSLAAGMEVNLERAVRAGDRLGGHIVQGHVDDVGAVVTREPSDHWELFTVRAPARIVRYLVPKGSITIDGVSLTVVDVSDGNDPSFTVSLIPTTLADTTLGGRQIGDLLNLEVDILAKYVERLLP